MYVYVCLSVCNLHLLFFNKAMTYQNVHSRWSIPFSWEDKPGVSKNKTNQDCPIGLGLHTLNLKLSSLLALPHSPNLPSSITCINGSNKIRCSNVTDQEKQSIPLPPCLSSQTLHRSTSKKILKWWQQDYNGDPFLAAYKECTKSSIVANGKSSRKIKKSNVICNSDKGRRSTRSIFSCKNSCEVRDDSFMMHFTNFSSLHKDQIRVSSLKHRH